MWNVIHETKQKARKNYHCDSSGYLLDLYSQGIDTKFTFTEMRAMVEARQSNCTIFKGETYIRQFNGDGGDTCVWRAKPEIHEICIKYKLYEDDW